MTDDEQSLTVLYKTRVLYNFFPVSLACLHGGVFDLRYVF
jgi:hypothetical protein